MFLGINSQVQCCENGLWVQSILLGSFREDKKITKYISLEWNSSFELCISGIGESLRCRDGLDYWSGLKTQYSSWDSSFASLSLGCRTQCPSFPSLSLDVENDVLRLWVKCMYNKIKYVQKYSKNDQKWKPKVVSVSVLNTIPKFPQSQSWYRTRCPGFPSLGLNVKHNAQVFPVSVSMWNTMPRISSIVPAQSLRLWSHQSLMHINMILSRTKQMAENWKKMKMRQY